jgi:hypothetical protein
MGEATRRHDKHTHVPETNDDERTNNMQHRIEDEEHTPVIAADAVVVIELGDDDNTSLYDCIHA